ncbi:MAG: hypothetical protein WC527_05010 [Candidatus Margulisiibacteriota bacterium]
MAVQLVSRYGFDAVMLTNRHCPAQAMIARQGARPLAYWPKGEASGFSALYTNPAKPARSTHICWPNFGRLSLIGDGSDIKLDENGIPTIGGTYGQYSLEKYRLGDTIRTLQMHGPSRTEDWEVIQPAENFAIMTYHHQPDKHFPFEAKLTVQALLTDSGSFSYDVTTTGPMITDLAIHTYLTWLKGMKVRGLKGVEYFEGSDWARSASNPLRSSETVFDTLTALEKHCILNGRKVFDLGYPSADIRMRYSVFGEPVHPNQMILWADPNEGDFACMEPELCERNSINNGTAYQLRKNHSLSLGFSLEQAG